MVVGIIVFFVLPSSPTRARYLSEEQKRLAAWRISGDAAGVADEGDKTSFRQGLRLILKDWKVGLGRSC